MKKTLTRISYRPHGKRVRYWVVFSLRFPAAKELPVLPYRRILIIADKNISADFVQSVQKSLSVKNRHTTIYRIEASRKTLDRLSTLWKHMVSFVPDLVVGVGGGTTCDLVGFAASTYQRGIPHMLVPTTVLGMLDASLGGKTAIDFHGVKNSIGAVHYPIVVCNALEALKALKKKEFFSGFSEAVKAAVLFDSKFFTDIQAYATAQDFSYTNPRLFDLIQRSAKLKMKNAEDPPSHKIKLLYGHAIGHAVEILQRISHGDAVAVGMTIEGAMACLLGIWNEEEWRQQTRLLRALKLPVVLREPKRVNEIIEKMTLYKKLVTRESFGFILPRAVGAVYKQTASFITYVPRKKMRPLLIAALQFIETHT